MMQTYTDRCTYMSPHNLSTHRIVSRVEIENSGCLCFLQELASSMFSTNVSPSKQNYPEFSENIKKPRKSQKRQGDGTGFSR